jgi:2-iminoacetate synthase
MEFAIPGFIEKLCTPNALTTLQEYLVDYASPDTRAAGEAVIAEELLKMPDAKTRARTAERLYRISSTEERDLFS